MEKAQKTIESTKSERTRETQGDIVADLKVRIADLELQVEGVQGFIDEFEQGAKGKADEQFEQQKGAIDAARQGVTELDAQLKDLSKNFTKLEVSA